MPVHLFVWFFGLRYFWTCYTIHQSIIYSLRWLNCNCGFLSVFKWLISAHIHINSLLRVHKIICLNIPLWWEETWAILVSLTQILGGTWMPGVRLSSFQLGIRCENNWVILWTSNTICCLIINGTVLAWVMLCRFQPLPDRFLRVKVNSWLTTEASHFRLLFERCSEFFDHIYVDFIYIINLFYLRLLI